MRLAAEQAGLDFEQGVWMLRALRSSTHLRLGYASFAEYTGRLFGLSPRLVADKLRVAEALEDLPVLAGALARGVLPWSAVRELARVATPSTEAQWLDDARGKTVREIERRVTGLRAGDRPGDRPDASLKKHVLRFEVSAETLSTVREAMAKVRRDAGAPLDDDAVLLEASRRVLGGPVDAGRSSYQVLLTRCEACGRGRQEGGGELCDVEPAVMEMAECDAQHVTASAASTEPAEHDAESAEHDAEPAEHDEAASSGRGATHVGRAAGRPAKRATQSIPPAVRREVLRRDAHRCIVPGCRNAVWVDVHHTKPRSEGGNHDPDGLATLCGAHHRAAHRGEIAIDGSASTGFVVRHADGTPYGGAVHPATARASAMLFGALRNMGFRETEARRALGTIETHVGAGEPIAELLRRALAVLAPGARAGA
jgi:hypothetical protein